MKVGIHHREGSFTDRWIAYCEREKIPYALVNCYESSIVKTLQDERITHLMWHPSHSSATDLMLFPYVMNSADSMGIKTFPNFQTRWHFDDKVAQKYLLEAIDAPFIESHVFYDKDSALRFIEETKFPWIAKLKGGAGSANVKLLKDKTEAKDYTNKLFGEGIHAIGKPLSNIKQKIRIAKKNRNPIVVVKKGLAFISRIQRERSKSQVEKGYVYFQKFLPNNDFDTRIIVVGNKAFGIRRMVHEDDFRASGSGLIDYSANMIDKEMISLAFKISEELKAQCLAYDFIYDENKEIKVIEICFGFSMKAYDLCEGYWDSHLNFYEGSFNPQEFMISDFLSLE